MLNCNKAKFWASLISIVILYGAFLSYVAVASPKEPNDIIIEQKTAKECIIASDTKTTTPQKADGSTLNNYSLNNIVKEEKIDKKNIGPEVYLCEITNFYERVITILSILIGVILGVNFLYLHSTSKRQAEDLAREALKEDAFAIKLDKLIKEHFATEKKEGDIAEFLQGVEEITQKTEEFDKRLEFIEKAITDNSYKGKLKEE